MKDVKYIFNVNTAHGLSEYAFDTVKLLLEDKEFFENNILLLDQNDFSDLNVRRIVGVMKDLYAHLNICPSADTLKMHVERTITNEFEKEEIEEFFEMIKSRTLDDDRKKEVKETILYLNTFANVCRVRNISNDGLSSRMDSVGSLVKLAKDVIAAAEKLERSLEQLDYHTTKTSGDWIED